MQSETVMLPSYYHYLNYISSPPHNYQLRQSRLLLHTIRTRPRTTGKTIPIGSIEYQPVSLPRRARRRVRHAATAGTEDADIGTTAEESPATTAYSVEAFATAEWHCVDV